MRQLAVRARRNVEAARPRFPVEREEGERIAQAFFAASTSGDTAALRTLLPECGAALRWRRQGFGLHQPHHWIGPPPAHVRGCAAQMGARLGADTRTRLDRRLARYISRERGDVLQTMRSPSRTAKSPRSTLPAIPTSSATSRRRSRWHRSLPRGHSDQAAGAPGSACLTFSLSRCARSLEAEGNNRRGRGRLPLGLRLTVGSRRGAMSALPCCRSIADRRKTTQSSRSHRRRFLQSVGWTPP